MTTDLRARILIVEDHQVVADGLAALINDQQDMTVIGQAGSVSDAISRATELTRHRPHGLPVD
ncbi:MAG TPA: hypothetical protein VGS16_14810 [Candidatus Dormibacteraeota bacterium]|nr:hypothetical protein [Candidatus Dormibacteraeota bacterium]